MRIAECHLESEAGSPYSSSRNHEIPKKEKESADVHDLRTWRERAHYDDDTKEVYIPSMAFKFALMDVAKRLNLQIPGRGKSTYAKSFTQGVLCVERVMLGVKVDAMQAVRVYCHADGVRGSGKRVFRTFPFLPKWKGILRVMLTDDLLPKDIFERVLRECGMVNGVGRFRAGNGGLNGMFRVTKIKWADTME